MGKTVFIVYEHGIVLECEVKYSGEKLLLDVPQLGLKLFRPAETYPTFKDAAKASINFLTTRVDSYLGYIGNLSQNLREAAELHLSLPAPVEGK